MADWLAGVDLLDPEAVAAAARPVMAAMTNPNGLDRAEACYGKWLKVWDVLPQIVAMKNEPTVAYQIWQRRTLDALQAVGLDLMDGDDWRESATGVSG